MNRSKRLEQSESAESGTEEPSLYEMLKTQGYAPNRARYIVNGSPYGKNRKAMKRWLLEQKHRPK